MARKLKWGEFTERQCCFIAVVAITVGIVLSPFGPSHLAGADEPTATQSQAVQLTID